MIAVIERTVQAREQEIVRLRKKKRAAAAKGRALEALQIQNRIDHLSRLNQAKRGPSSYARFPDGKRRQDPLPLWI